MPKRKQIFLRSIARTQLTRLTWVFTPGHAGVSGNERADRLAGSAQLMHDLQLSEADVLENIRIKRPLTAEEDSATVQRLCELGVKRGSGCKSTLRGLNRHRVNQITTGTISTVTLRWWLEGLTERVWCCPMCHDVYPGNK